MARIRRVLSVHRRQLGGHKAAIRSGHVQPLSQFSSILREKARILVLDVYSFVDGYNFGSFLIY